MRIKQIIIHIFLLTSFISYSQLKDEVEGYYLEDQIYAKFAYNILNNLPESIEQSGFSNSISFGFIRDIPINKDRNFGFGLGLGYGLNTYFHNLKIFKSNDEILFENFQIDENYESNRLIVHAIEIPLEIRWRTSTREKYKFWRIYGGIKANYIFNSKVKYKLDNITQELKNLKEIKKLQYGLSLATGYGNINFYIYYSLTPLFENAYYNGNKIETKDIKIGIQFYIL